jgi:hypothetical protein
MYIATVVEQREKRRREVVASRFRLYRVYGHQLEAAGML